MSNRYGLEIRAASPADAPDLAEMLTACGVAVSALELARRLQTLQAGGGAVLVAVEWGPPSGLVAVQWCQTLGTARPVAEVTTLLVGPDSRRRGVGRLLLKAAAQAARLADCGTLRLGVAPGQDDLRGFCAANGFAEHDTGFVRPLRKGGKAGG